MAATAYPQVKGTLGYHFGWMGQNWIALGTRGNLAEFEPSADADTLNMIHQRPVLDMAHDRDVLDSQHVREKLDMEVV